MMASTYTPITSTTLTSATATVTFSSIPGTYTDLVLVANYIPSSLGNTIRMTFNSDTGSNYSKTYVGGYTGGSGYGSTRFSNVAYLFNQWQVGAASTTSPTLVIYNIMNYSNTTTNKTVVFRSNTIGTSSEVSAEVGLWRSTAAISTITMTNSSVTFATGSTFTLYGIKAA